jgi:hypothetical protein
MKQQMKNMKNYLLVAVATVAIFISCRKADDMGALDTYATFESNAQGIPANETSIILKVKLSAAARTDIPVVLNVTELGVMANTDYTTVPAASAGKIHLVIPSGNNEASVVVNKSAGILFDGDEQLIFDIYSTGSPVIIGTAKQLTLNFGELVSVSSTATIDGGGATFSNKVFIDLSANRHTAVTRTNWDLGFYGGSDDWRVILNSSVNMMAKQINKNDLNTVTAADTIGLSNEVAFSQSNPVATSLPYIDYPDGNLSRTAIAQISANAQENKVYIVNRGNAVGNPAPVRGWKKIRIIRNANGGYTLQHADIAATSFTSIDIAKDEAYNFKYASFENGAIAVEPQKNKWDFAWSYFANSVVFPGLGEVPYLYQDIILINKRVSVAKVMITTKAYADFNMGDVAAQTFLTAQNAIGADWRSGGGPTSAPAVRTDRYYIIKDADGNYYKLMFTALTDNNGTRGYPAYKSDKL